MNDTRAMKAAEEILSTVNDGWIVQHTTDEPELMEGATKVIAAIISRHYPGWIEIEEGKPETLPPEDGREVILRGKRGGTTGSVVAHFMPGGYCIEDHPAIERGWYWWTGSMFDLVRMNVTHWMALPQPPEVKR